MFVYPLSSSGRHQETVDEDGDGTDSVDASVKRAVLVSPYDLAPEAPSKDQDVGCLTSERDSEDSMDECSSDTDVCRCDSDSRVRVDNRFFFALRRRDWISSTDSDTETDCSCQEDDSSDSSCQCDADTDDSDDSLCLRPAQESSVLCHDISASDGDIEECVDQHSSGAQQHDDEPTVYAPGKEHRYPKYDDVIYVSGDDGKNKSGDENNTYPDDPPVFAPGGQARSPQNYEAMHSSDGESDTEEETDESLWETESDFASDTSKSSDLSTSDGQSEESSDDDTETDEDEAGNNVSTPTGLWSKSEMKRGYLVSRGPAPVSGLDFDEAGFVEFAGHHCAWRAQQLSLKHEVLPGTEFMRLLHEWATAFDHVQGKWMVFADPSAADALWRALCVANAAGSLGGYCEAHPLNLASDTHYLAVYCADFNNVPDCTRVLAALHAVCERAGAEVAAFKPDFLSTLGIGARRGAAPDTTVCYTFDALRVAGVWQRPALRAALDAVRAAGRAGARRGGRRRQREAEPANGSDSDGADGPPFRNPYASNVRHRPSRPNGAWTAREVERSWLEHATAWVTYGRVVDKDAFTRRARRLLDGYVRAWGAGEVGAAEKREVMRQVWALAAEHRFVCGKWKVFVPPGVADQLWTAVCAALDGRRLGDYAKVSQFNERSGKFLICVYCNDFTDTAHCKRVLYNLAGICEPFGVRVTANFKADFLTELGVYGVRDYRYNSSERVQYPLKKLGLQKFWPNDQLKEVLDEMKKKQRWS